MVQTLREDRRERTTTPAVARGRQAAPWGATGPEGRS